MPQLRKDPVTSRWVIVNVENPMKAVFFHSLPYRRSTRQCPFCPGNESMTPPEIMALGRKAGSKAPSSWLVRVIPNKFPALRIEENTELISNGVYSKVGGFGAHEVIIENPDHDKTIPDLPEEHVMLLLQAFRDRCLDLRKDARFKYILLFKNYGASAGASLEHPHSQLIGLPIVPSRVVGEIVESGRYYEMHKRCLFCDMLIQEDKERRLTVYENEGFKALTPFASRFPFETWILPKSHQSTFDCLADADLRTLARLFKLTLAKIKNALNDPSYNFMIHTAPLFEKDLKSYHWHIEIIPNLTRVAGFELGSGFYVNPTSPELAAETLKYAFPRA